MTRAARPLPPQPRRLSLVGGVVIAGLVVAAAGLFGPAWLEKREARARASQVDASAQAVLADFSKGLPRPYGPGLVLERATLEGPRLVLWIRSEKRSAAEARRNPLLLDRTREGEQGLLLGFCKDPNVVGMLAQGLVITRRFLGSDRQLLFEVSLTGADCVAVR